MSTKISVRNGIVEATEPMGIGGVTVLPPRSGWTTLKIRLRQTPERGLVWAEGLTIITDNIRGRGSFKEQARFRWSGDNPILIKPWFSQEGARSASGPHFRATRSRRGLQFEFDQEFLGNTESLRLNWVDYYRR